MHIIGIYKDADKNSNYYNYLFSKDQFNYEIKFKDIKPNISKQNIRKA